MFKKKDSDGLDEYGNPLNPAEGQEMMGEEVMQPPAPRIHESDKTGDVKSLDRMGERNLYLIVRGKDRTGKQVWRFPEGGLGEGEVLHQVRTVITGIGIGMCIDGKFHRRHCGICKPSVERTWTLGLWARNP